MDWSSILVALLALLGTVLGSVLGIREANRLVSYRLEQLEKKVDRHNQVISRTYVLEQGQAVLEERIRSAEHRMDGLEAAERRAS